MNNLTLSRAINVNNKYYKKNTILESAIVTLICIKKKLNMLFSIDGIHKIKHIFIFTMHILIIIAQSR